MERFPLARTLSTLADDSSLLESGIVDSLGVLDLISFLESEFAITLSSDDLLPSNFESIARMAASVDRKRGNT